ncbi:zinc-binding dehydrogenase [Mycobacteroides chelonae]|uniref:zinc-binding dehydrogenase n=1 Tax=Mycobacteroides chelonae TaxID=1774 RepID=UPI00099425E4|nr:zinc-binding dehydrogenase [Mycobacteroides chelonae]
MKAWVITREGGPEVLALRDVDLPDLQPGEVAIKVKAFGINAAERYRRLGKMGPVEGVVVPGIEAVGEVVADPSGRLATGTAVATIMGGLQFDRFGSYAEQVNVLASNVFEIPPNSLGWAQLAALPQSYITAWGAVEKSLWISAGATLLVRGAASALGLSATSLAAKVIGANVIGIVRSDKDLDAVKRAGAAQVLIDSSDLTDKIRELAPAGVEGVLDIVGGHESARLSRVVRPFGKVTVVGLLAGPPVFENFSLTDDLAPAVSIGFFPSQLVGSPALPITEAPLNLVIDAVASGTIPSQLAATYGFEDVRRVHESLDGPRAPGKIVVTL